MPNLSTQVNSIRKQVALPVISEIRAQDRIEPLWSTADIDENASTVDFFPRSPSGSNILHNYDSIPLPGDYPRNVFGASLNLTVGTVRSTDLAAVDPDAILAEFRNGVLEITADADECLLLRTPLHKLMALDEATVERTEDSTAGSIYSTLKIPSQGVQLFENGFRIGNGQVFDAKVKFADGSAFPAPADVEPKALALRLELLSVIKMGGSSSNGSSNGARDSGRNPSRQALLQQRRSPLHT